MIKNYYIKEGYYDGNKDPNDITFDYIGTYEKTNELLRRMSSALVMGTIGEEKKFNDDESLERFMTYIKKNEPNINYRMSGKGEGKKRFAKFANKFKDVIPVTGSGEDGIEGKEKSILQKLTDLFLNIDVNVGVASLGLKQKLLIYILRIKKLINVLEDIINSIKETSEKPGIKHSEKVELYKSEKTLSCILDIIKKLAEGMEKNIIGSMTKDEKQQILTKNTKDKIIKWFDEKSEAEYNEADLNKALAEFMKNTSTILLKTNEFSEILKLLNVTLEDIEKYSITELKKAVEKLRLDSLNKKITLPENFETRIKELEDIIKTIQTHKVGKGAEIEEWGDGGDLKDLTKDSEVKIYELVIILSNSLKSIADILGEYLEMVEYIYKKDFSKINLPSLITCKNIIVRLSDFFKTGGKGIMEIFKFGVEYDKSYQRRELFDLLNRLSSETIKIFGDDDGTLKKFSDIPTKLSKMIQYYRNQVEEQISKMGFIDIESYQTFLPRTMMSGIINKRGSMLNILKQKIVYLIQYVCFCSNSKITLTNLEKIQDKKMGNLASAMGWERYVNGEIYEKIDKKFKELKVNDDILDFNKKIYDSTDKTLKFIECIDIMINQYHHKILKEPAILKNIKNNLDIIEVITFMETHREVLIGGCLYNLDKNDYTDAKTYATTMLNIIKHKSLRGSLGIFGTYTTKENLNKKLNEIITIFRSSGAIRNLLNIFMRLIPDVEFNIPYSGEELYDIVTEGLAYLCFSPVYKDNIRLSSLMTEENEPTIGLCPDKSNEDMIFPEFYKTKEPGFGLSYLNTSSVLGLVYDRTYQGVLTSLYAISGFIITVTNSDPNISQTDNGDENIIMTRLVLGSDENRPYNMIDQKCVALYYYITKIFKFTFAITNISTEENADIVLRGIPSFGINNIFGKILKYYYVYHNNIDGKNVDKYKCKEFIAMINEYNEALEKKGITTIRDKLQETINLSTSSVRLVKDNIFDKLLNKNPGTIKTIFEKLLSSDINDIKTLPDTKNLKSLPSDKYSPYTSESENKNKDIKLLKKELEGTKAVSYTLPGSTPEYTDIGALILLLNRLKTALLNPKLYTQSPNWSLEITTDLMEKKVKEATNEGEREAIVMSLLTGKGVSGNYETCLKMDKSSLISTSYHCLCSIVDKLFGMKKVVDSSNIKKMVESFVSKFYRRNPNQYDNVIGNGYKTSYMNDFTYEGSSGDIIKNYIRSEESFLQSTDRFVSVKPADVYGGGTDISVKGTLYISSETSFKLLPTARLGGMKCNTTDIIYGFPRLLFTHHIDENQATLLNTTFEGNYIRAIRTDTGPDLTNLYSWIEYAKANLSDISNLGYAFVYYEENNDFREGFPEFYEGIDPMVERRTNDLKRMTAEYMLDHEEILQALFGILETFNIMGVEFKSNDTSDKWISWDYSELKNNILTLLNNSISLWENILDDEYITQIEKASLSDGERSFKRLHHYFNELIFEVRNKEGKTITNFIDYLLEQTLMNINILMEYERTHAFLAGPVPFADWFNVLENNKGYYYNYNSNDYINVGNNPNTDTEDDKPNHIINGSSFFEDFIEVREYVRTNPDGNRIVSGVPQGSVSKVTSLLMSHQQGSPGLIYNCKRKYNFGNCIITKCKGKPWIRGFDDSYYMFNDDYMISNVGNKISQLGDIIINTQASPVRVDTPDVNYKRCGFTRCKDVIFRHGSHGVMFNNGIYSLLNLGYDVKKQSILMKVLDMIYGSDLSAYLSNENVIPDSFISTAEWGGVVYGLNDKMFLTSTVQNVILAIVNNPKKTTGFNTISSVFELETQDKESMAIYLPPLSEKFKFLQKSIKLEKIFLKKFKNKADFTYSSPISIVFDNFDEYDPMPLQSHMIDGHSSIYNNLSCLQKTFVLIRDVHLSPFTNNFDHKINKHTPFKLSETPSKKIWKNTGGRALDTLSSSYVSKEYNYAITAHYTINSDSVVNSVLTDYDIMENTSDHISTSIDEIYVSLFPKDDNSVRLSDVTNEKFIRTSSGEIIPMWFSTVLGLIGMTKKNRNRNEMESIGPMIEFTEINKRIQSILTGFYNKDFPITQETAVRFLEPHVGFYKSRGYDNEYMLNFIRSLHSVMNIILKERYIIPFIHPRTNFLYSFASRFVDLKDNVNRTTLTDITNMNELEMGKPELTSLILSLYDKDDPIGEFLKQIKKSNAKNDDEELISDNIDIIKVIISEGLVGFNPIQILSELPMAYMSLYGSIFITEFIKHRIGEKSLKSYKMLNYFRARPDSTYIFLLNSKNEVNFNKEITYPIVTPDDLAASILLFPTTGINSLYLSRGGLFVRMLEGDSILGKSFNHFLDTWRVSFLQFDVDIVDDTFGPFNIEKISSLKRLSKETSDRDGVSNLIDGANRIRYFTFKEYEFFTSIVIPELYAREETNIQILLQSETEYLDIDFDTEFDKNKFNLNNFNIYPDLSNYDATYVPKDYEWEVSNAVTVMIESFTSQLSFLENLKYYTKNMSFRLTKHGGGSLCIPTFGGGSLILPVTIVDDKYIGGGEGSYINMTDFDNFSTVKLSELIDYYKVLINEINNNIIYDDATGNRWFCVNYGLYNINNLSEIANNINSVKMLGTVGAVKMYKANDPDIMDYLGPILLYKSYAVQDPLTIKKIIAAFDKKSFEPNYDNRFIHHSKKNKKIEDTNIDKNYNVLSLDYSTENTIFPRFSTINTADNFNNLYISMFTNNNVINYNNIRDDIRNYFGRGNYYNQNIDTTLTKSKDEISDLKHKILENSFDRLPIPLSMKYKPPDNEDIDFIDVLIAQMCYRGMDVQSFIDKNPTLLQSRYDSILEKYPDINSYKAENVKMNESLKNVVSDLDNPSIFSVTGSCVVYPFTFVSLPLINDDDSYIESRLHKNTYTASLFMRSLELYELFTHMILKILSDKLTTNDIAPFGFDVPTSTNISIPVKDENNPVLPRIEHISIYDGDEDEFEDNLNETALIKLLRESGKLKPNTVLGKTDLVLDMVYKSTMDIIHYKNKTNHSILNSASNTFGINKNNLFS